MYWEFALMYFKYAWTIVLFCEHWARNRYANSFCLLQQSLLEELEYLSTYLWITLNKPRCSAVVLEKACDLQKILLIVFCHIIGSEKLTVDLKIRMQYGLCHGFVQKGHHFVQLTQAIVLVDDIVFSIASCVSYLLWRCYSHSQCRNALVCISNVFKRLKWKQVFRDGSFLKEPDFFNNDRGWVSRCLCLHIVDKWVSDARLLGSWTVIDE